MPVTLMSLLLVGLVVVVVVVLVVLILDTQAFVRIFRFGRFSSPRRIGWMYATLALDRRPSSGL